MKLEEEIQEARLKATLVQSGSETEPNEMLGADVPNTADDFVFYYDPPGKDGGICRVRIYRHGQLPNQNIVVIMTELADNYGASITSASEVIATQLCWEQELNPGRTIWIEHYPVHQLSPLGNPKDKERFAIVTYTWQGQEAISPTFLAVDKETVETLTGQSLY